jgi:hypothetical protein
MGWAALSTKSGPATSIAEPSSSRAPRRSSRPSFRAASRRPISESGRRLALAENRPASVSWAVSEEGGPTLVQVPPDATSLSALPRFVVGCAWPVLAEALGDDELTSFLLASGGIRRPGLKGPYGLAAYFDRAQVEALAERIDRVPVDAIGRLTDPFASLHRYGMSEGDGIDVPWFEAQLTRLRQVLHEGQAIAVTIS